MVNHQKRKKLEGLDLLYLPFKFILNLIRKGLPFFGQFLARLEWRVRLFQLQAFAGSDDYNHRWGESRQALYKRYGPFLCSRNDILRLRSLHNIHKGKRIFIIGNGPSLNKTPLEKLEGEYTFGTNRIYLLFNRIKWRPTFYTANDWRVGADCSNEINTLSGMTFFFPEHFRGLFRGGDDVYWHWYGQSDSGDPLEKIFAYDVSTGLRGAGSVTGSAIQLAYYMGFDPIYLIGCDANYTVSPDVKQSGPDCFGDGVLLKLESVKDDDPNHFDPRYFGKGRKWHNPNVPRMIQGYENCKKAIEAKGRRIYNATVGGKLEIFERVDINSLF